MRGHKHIWKGEQTGQFVIVQDLSREIFKENAFLFLVDIQRNATDVSALQGLDEGPGMNKAPRLTLMSITPGFVRAKVSLLAM